MTEPEGKTVTRSQSYLLKYLPEGERRRIIKNKRGLTIRGDIPSNIQIPNGARILVISDDQTYLTHGLHKYPAKFIPEYPRWVIQRYTPSPGHFVLDPFCGSGTTNVEARLHKQNSYAIDVDPLAKLITKAKTTPLDVFDLKLVQKRILRRLHKPVPGNIDVPDFPNVHYWFKPHICKDLAFLKEVIDEEAEESDIHNFFLVCFSSIIRQVSNADPKLVLPKVSRLMREKEKKGRKVDVFLSFRKIVSKQIPNIIMFSHKCPKNEPYFTEIIEKDARDIRLSSESIDVAITSPPYLNAHDYVRAHHLEMYWLGLLASQEEKMQLRSEFIGTERVCAKEYAELHETGKEELDEALKKIFMVDKRRSYIVYKYFVDMKKSFEEVYRVLKHDSYYVMFIGDNVIRRVPIATHKYLMEYAEDAGFVTKLTFASKLIKRFEISQNRDVHGGFIEEDWVLLFQKE